VQLISGVIAPNLTPFNDDLSIATELYVDHAHALLSEGCSALAPFGTTGEALSVGIAERKETLARLVKSGLDPARLIPGTGLTSLSDTVALTKHAVEHGCYASMTLPPFYFKGVSDEGIYVYFAKLIEAVNDDRLRLILYHIPPVAHVGFSVSLTKRLAGAFSANIVGIKDSSGEFAHTRDLLRLGSWLAVYPGSELNLREAAQLGAPGCITATANINATAIIRAYALRSTESGAEAQSVISAYRKALQPYGPIPAMKALLAARTKNPRWQNVRPPLVPLPAEQLTPLRTDLAASATPLPLKNN